MASASVLTLWMPNKIFGKCNLVPNKKFLKLLFGAGKNFRFLTPGAGENLTVNFSADQQPYFFIFWKKYWSYAKVLYIFFVENWILYKMVKTASW